MQEVHRPEGPMYEGFRERVSSIASEPKTRPTWRKILGVVLGSFAIVGITVAGVALIKPATKNQLKATYALNIESDGYATVSGIGGAYEPTLPKGRMRIVADYWPHGTSLEEEIRFRNLCASHEQGSLLVKIAEQLNANPKTSRILARGGTIVIEDNPNPILTPNEDFQHLRYLLEYPGYQCPGLNRWDHAQ